MGHKLTICLFERDRVPKLCKSDNVMSGLDLSPFFFFEGLNFNFTPISSVVGSHLYPSAVPDNFAIASSSLEPLVTNVLRDNPTLFNNLGIVPVNWFVRGSLVPIILDTSFFDPPTNQFTGTIP